MRYAVLFFFFFFFSLDFPNGASSGEARHVGSDGRFHRISMIGSSVGQWPTAAPRSAVAVAATRAPISVQQPNGRQIKRQNMELMGWGWRGNDDQKKKKKKKRIEIRADEWKSTSMNLSRLGFHLKIYRPRSTSNVRWTWTRSMAFGRLGRATHSN